MPTGVPTLPPSAHPSAAVHQVRRFPAPREDVFRAWTEPEQVSQWFGARGAATAVREMEVRIGGSNRIELRHAFGFAWTTYVVGEYLEVAPPERLVYTFAWERPPPPAFGMDPSRVTVEFRDFGDSTEVRLTHELLAKRRLRAFHRLGWDQSLGKLEDLLERLRAT